MTAPAPWQERALEDTLDSALTCVATVEAVHPTAGVVALNTVNLTLTWDEARTPAIHLAGAVKATPDALGVLVEDVPVRIKIRAGYIYAGGEEDVHLLCDLLLERATVQSETGLIPLEAWSDEYDLTRPAWTVPAAWTSATPFGTAVRQILARIGVASLDIAPDLDAASFLEPGETLQLRIDDSLNNALRDISDRVGARVWHDGLGVWHAAEAGVIGDVVATITTGPRGLASSVESQRDAGTFGNAQLVIHRWRTSDGVEHEVIGRAEQLTGPLGVNTIGRRVRPAVVRTRSASQAAANRAADTILARAITRRRAIATESARALWWIRPTDRIRVESPDELPVLGIVSAVTFDLRTCTMQTRTRIPEEA